MSIYKEQLTQFLYEQRQLLNLYENEMRQLPDGSLIYSTNNGKRYYYQSAIENDRHVRIPLNGHPEMVRALARKEFLRKSVEALSTNIKLLENAERHYVDEQFDALRAGMHKAYQDLPEAFFLNSDVQGAGIYRLGDEYAKRRHDAWAKEPYEMSKYKPERRRFPTSAGVNVRSKSEQHIVEQLYKYGVPFRYEQVIHLDESTAAPDFTFEAFDGNWFYWEHAGMMDVSGYADRHNRKMRSFEAFDIVPWRNLIVTYDVDGVINVPMINSIIENEVIPRL